VWGTDVVILATEWVLFKQFSSAFWRRTDTSINVRVVCLEESQMNEEVGHKGGAVIINRFLKSV
jgi:hypothetical protein